MTFTMDAEVAAVLQAALEKNGPPPTPQTGDVHTRRVTLDAMLEYFYNQAQPLADDVKITDHEVTTADGATLLARWYRRPASDTGAAVLYLHGGGMIVGSVPIFDGPVSRYVARTGVPMLSAQYRLAPEHPHPVPVEDAYAGLTWLAGHAGQLGIDPGRIAVMGDSAGGGLAAGVAILSRDRQGPAIAHQLLIYPMLDDRTTTPDPYIAPFAGWSYDDNATGWNALLGAGHEKRDVDPAAAPGRLKDARGLPASGGSQPQTAHACRTEDRPNSSAARCGSALARASSQSSTNSPSPVSQRAAAGDSVAYAYPAGAGYA